MTTIDEMWAMENAKISPIAERYVASWKSGIPLSGWDGVRLCRGYFTDDKMNKSQLFWIAEDGGFKGHSIEDTFETQDEAQRHYLKGVCDLLDEMKGRIIELLQLDIKGGESIKLTPEQIEQLVEIDYTNFRGERAKRVVLPIEFVFGDTEHHKGNQHFMRAIDVARNVERIFAMKDIHSWSPGRLPDEKPTE